MQPDQQGVRKSTDADLSPPAASPDRRDRLNALIAGECWNCRVRPPRDFRQPFHTDADLCEPCDEALAGVDQLFEE
jgi:hypothetical protein